MLVITVEIDGVEGDAQGAKEAVAARLEGLGGRPRVRRVEVRSGQMALDGPTAPAERPGGTPAGRPEGAAAGGGRESPAKREGAPAGRPESEGDPAKPRRARPIPMRSCFNCSARGPASMGEDGRMSWGTCLATGLPVESLRDVCARWEGI